jgi:hypothetical protein
VSEAKKAGDGQGRFDRRDFVGLAGLVLVGAGAGWIFPPAGLIIPGAILTAVAIFGVKG